MMLPVALKGCRCNLAARRAESCTVAAQAGRRLPVCTRSNGQVNAAGMVTGDFVDAKPHVTGAKT